jgi:hypothetical protein
LKVLFAAALIGATLGFALFWPYEALTALLGAQLGACALALRRSRVERKQSAGFKLISRS